MKTDRYNYSLMAVLSLLMFTACVNDSSDFAALYEADEALRSAEVKTIAFDYTAYDTVEDAADIPADDNDYVENSSFPNVINIVYSDEDATLSGDVDAVTTYKNGAHVTIVSNTKNIIYKLSGSTSNGSFKIYSKNKFALSLENVSITNPSGAAINNQGEYGAGGSGTKTMYVVLPEGCVNTLTDGTSYVNVAGEQMKGTLFSEGQVIFSGAGSLVINGNYKNGIASDDYIVFRPGVQIAVNCTAASGHGVKANDGIIVRGGTLNVSVTGAAAKGFNSEARITVEGGRTTVIATGEPLVESNDTSNCAGIKCDSTLYVKGGIMNLMSTGEGGKGINVTGDIEMSAGELNVVATGNKDKGSPKGIKCGKNDSDLAGNMTVSGGCLYSYSANSSALDIKGVLSIADGYSTYKNTGSLFDLRY